MDWKAIMGTVVGSLILGSIVFLFSSIGESKHQDDIQNVHLEYLKKSDEKQWGMFDTFTQRYIETLINENNKLRDKNQNLRDAD